MADKGYDGSDFVNRVFHRWKGIKIVIPLRRTNQGKVAKRRESELNRILKGAERDLNPDLFKKRTEIERYFSRIKRVFGLGEERTRGLINFRANCYLVSIARILEWLASPSLWLNYSPNSLLVSGRGCRRRYRRGLCGQEEG